MPYYSNSIIQHQMHITKKEIKKRSTNVYIYIYYLLVSKAIIVKNKNKKIYILCIYYYIDTWICNIQFKIRAGIVVCAALYAAIRRYLVMNT
jgi:hypothetical protein